MNVKTKRRHKHVKLLKITKYEAERLEVEYAIAKVFMY